MMENGFDFIKEKKSILLDYLFCEFKRPIDTDEDYQELGEIFDKDE
jgi:hypothetical protein